MKIKILYLGIPSIHLKRWVKPFFDDKDFEVLVTAFSSDAKVSVFKKIPIVLVKNSFGRAGYVLTIPKFRKILQEYKPDIIHAHFVSSYGYVSSSLHFHPLVLSAWGSDITVSAKDPVRKWFAKQALIKADVVNFAGEYLKRVAMEKMNFPVSKKSYVFQYGISIKEICSHSKPIENREQYTIVSPRGFRKIYNIENQLRAMKIVLSRYPKARMIMCGEGNEDMRKKATKLTSSLGISQSVTISSKVEQRVLWDLLGKAWIFLSIPHEDGTPLSLLEAMALGAFPIVSNIPPNREWIRNEINGFLVDKDDPSDIANAIIRAFESEELFKKSKSLNFKLVSERADYSKNISKMRSIYMELLNR